MSRGTIDCYAEASKYRFWFGVDIFFSARYAYMTGRNDKLLQGSLEMPSLGVEFNALAPAD